LLLCISKKDKEKLRKIAYKRKMTMSQYIRNIINLAIAINESNVIDDKKNISEIEIEKVISKLGGKYVK